MTIASARILGVCVGGALWALTLVLLVLFCVACSRRDWIAAGALILPANAGAYLGGVTLGRALR